MYQSRGDPFSMASLSGLWEQGQGSQLIFDVEKSSHALFWEKYTMAVPSFLGPLQILQSGAAPVAMTAPVAGSVGPSSATLSGFVMQSQLETNWCWAAVSTSIATFYGSRAWTQCSLATAELGLNCCGNNVPAACNVQWSLDSPLSRVGHYGRRVDHYVSFNDIQQEINTNRPLGCRVEWLGGSAHFVAVSGWSVGPDGTQYVDVEDPAFTFKQLPYDDFVSAYQTPGDSWANSYFIISAGIVAGGGVDVGSNAPKNG
jgi:hypothetical protein